MYKIKKNCENINIKYSSYFLSITTVDVHIQENKLLSKPNFTLKNKS